MLKKLITLANTLDNRGLQKEADYLDAIISKIAQSTATQSVKDIKKAQDALRLIRNDPKAMDIANRALELKASGDEAGGREVINSAREANLIQDITFIALITVFNLSMVLSSALLNELRLNPTASGRQLNVTDVDKLDLSPDGLGHLWKGMWMD